MLVGNIAVMRASELQRCFYCPLSVHTNNVTILTLIWSSVQQKKKVIDIRKQSAENIVVL